MKFRIKMTLSMLCLLSLIFGIGGSALISISFQTALEREKESAKSAYHMILNTLQVINDIDIRKFSSGMTNILEQIYSQSNASWSALRLKSSEDMMYEEGSVSKYLDDFSNEIEPAHCLITHFKD